MLYLIKFRIRKVCQKNDYLLEKKHNILFRLKKVSRSKKRFRVPSLNKNFERFEI